MSFEENLNNVEKTSWKYWNPKKFNQKWYYKLDVLTSQTVLLNERQNLICAYDLMIKLNTADLGTANAMLIYMLLEFFATEISQICLLGKTD